MAHYKFSSAANLSILDSGDVRTVDRLLSIRDPRSGSDLSSRIGLWDGLIHFFDSTSKTFPTGLLPRLRHRLERRGHTVEVDTDADEVVVPPIHEDYLYDFTLRDYQVESVNVALEQKRGLLWLATGAGKSAVLSAIAGAVVRATGKKFIVIVPNKYLLHQTSADVAKFLGADVAVGRVGDGLKELKADVIVGTYQTLLQGTGRGADPKIAALIHSAVGVLCDEAHHLGADGIGTLYRSAESAVFRLGCSGSLDKHDRALGKREDDKAREHRWRMEALTGPVLYEVDNKFLIEHGYNAKPFVRIVNCRDAFGPTVVTPPPNPSNPLAGMMVYKTVFDRAVIQDRRFLKSVCKVVAALLEQGMAPFVFSHSVEHLKALKATAESMRIPTEIVSGKDTVARRKEVIRRFNTSPDFAVLSSSLPHSEVIVIREHGEIKSVKIGDLVERYISKGTHGAVAVDGIETLSTDKSGFVKFRRLTAVHAHRRPSGVSVVSVKGVNGMRVNVTDNHALVDVQSWTNESVKDGASRCSVVSTVDLPVDFDGVLRVGRILSATAGAKVEISGWYPHRRYGTGLRTHIAFYRHVLFGEPLPANERNRRRISAIVSRIKNEPNREGILCYLEGVASGHIAREKSGASSIRGDGAFVVKVSGNYADDHHDTLSTLGELKVRLPRSKSTIPSRVNVDSDLSEFLGLFVAEGSVTENPSVSISHVAALVGNPAIRTIDGVDVVASEYNRKLAHRVMRRICGDFARVTDVGVTASSAVFAKFLLDVCKVGVHAANKCVPWFIFRSPLDMRRAFLKGLLMGDGSTGGTHMPGRVMQHVTTVSPYLAQGVNLLVRSLGEDRLSLAVSGAMRTDRHIRYAINSPDGSVVHGWSRKSKVKAVRLGGFVGNTRTGAMKVANYCDRWKTDDDITVYDVSVEGVENFAAGPGLVIAHNSIFDEGMSINGIRAVVLAGTRKSPVELLQRIGRGLRVKDDDNTLTVIDFDPLHSTLLHKQFRSRLGVYQEQGFDVKYITDLSNPDQLVFTNGKPITC